MKKWYLIPSYTMKCRLYPNKQQAEMIDRALYGLRIFYNSTLYGMKEKNECTKEKPAKDRDGVVHFPDFDAACNKEHLDKMRDEYPIIKSIPAYAMSGSNGIIKKDLVSSLSQLYVNKKEQKKDNESNKEQDKKGKSKNGKSKKINGVTMPFEFIDYEEIRFYSKSKPRRSLCYQRTAKSIKIKSNGEYVEDVSLLEKNKYNKNVIYINLGKFGNVDLGYAKIRGWNRNVRFDENGEYDFLDYVYKYPKQQITITIKKDNCNDYWICFTFSHKYNEKKKRYEGIAVYKEFDIPNSEKKVGIDVGKKTLMVCSDDDLNYKNFKNGKAENKKFKAKERKRLNALQKRLSRRQGWKNIEFMEEHKKDNYISPSKKYRRTELKYNKLNRKIARERNLYYHECTTFIEKNYSFIAVESLSVSDMFKDNRTDHQKDQNNENFVPNRIVKRTNENTADAALSMLLGMIKYKSDWYERVCIEIGRYYPSSKTCHVCKYIKKDLSLNDRFWVCPACGTKHDRDKNASIEILNEALRIYNKVE